jgi:hypothetical protein
MRRYVRSPSLSTHCEHRARTGAVFGGQNSCGPRQYGAGEDSVPGMLSAELSRGSISVSVSSLSLSLALALRGIVVYVHLLRRRSDSSLR